MDKTLRHAPAFYLEKLTLHSAETVEVKSATGLCNYKVNRYEQPIVVERLNNHFKIYFSKSPSLSPFTTASKSIDASSEYYAQISVDDDIVNIRIRMKKWSIVAIVFWILLGVTIGFLSSKLSICIFIAIVFLAAAAFLIHGRQKLKSTVVDFMNDL